MEVTNPRFPHWCRIVRKTVEDPMEDEDDFSPFVPSSGSSPSSDAEHDPMGSDYGDASPTDANSSTDEPLAEEPDEAEGGGADTSQVTVIYEGACRSYKVNTTSDKGEIVTSQRGLALPLNQDGWDELGMIPMEGDEVVVIHGTTFKEYGRVVDKNVATASYAGTHLVWRYGRN